MNFSAKYSVLYAVGLLWSLGGLVQADEVARVDTIKNGAKQIVEAVKATIIGENETAIVIDGFTGLADKTKTSGAGIRADLADAFKAAGIESKNSAKFSINGFFTAAPTQFEGEASKRPAGMIHFELRNSAGKRFQEGDVYIQKIEDVADLGGENLPPPDPKKAETPEQQNSTNLNAALRSDDHGASVLHIDGTRIYPSKDAKFSIEILKAPLVSKEQAPSLDKYTPVPPVKKADGIFVEIDNDEVYAVKIYNDSDRNLAAKLSIDGLSMFRFSKEREKRSDFWLFDKGRNYALVGWHKEGNRFASFLVEEYAEADHAAKIGDRNAVGTISVDFRHFYPSEQDAPAEDKGHLTKEGPQVEFLNEVRPCFIGKQTCGRIAIRYDRKFSDVPPK